ncbi:plastocyanin [Streptacidiphilus sp. MAP12-16]|uniref:hypothetical protein n=1 Tax=Streptacidiphilus sp. MAP12-16 TaxID=3156300 RepID=UPI003511E072
MRTTPAASIAVVSTAVLALSAPLALAEGGGGTITSFGFTVSPGTVAPGGTVTLNATGCEVPSVTVSSGVFDTVTLNEGHSATATVDSTAKPGAQYTVTFSCNGQTGTTELTISSTTPSTTPAAPLGPVRTGIGGSITRLDSVESAGGAALLAAAALGGTFALRRRNGKSAV